MKQVAVGGVNLDDVESSLDGALCGVAEGANDGGDSCCVEGLRDCVIRSERHGTGTDGLPCAFLWEQQALAAKGRRHAGFATGMGELYAGTRALRMNEGGDLFQPGDVVVFVNAEISGRDATVCSDGGGLDHDEAGSALGAAAEVNEMPVSGKAVL